MAKKAKIPDKYQVWIDVRKRYHPSHAHIQMARELGMNPKKMGKIANHKQEPWKAPLPVFIENLYSPSPECPVRKHGDEPTSPKHWLRRLKWRGDPP